MSKLAARVRRVAALIAKPARYLRVGLVPVEVVVGLELHAKLNIGSKLFSGELGLVHPLDEGMPGSLPVLNSTRLGFLAALARLLDSRLASVASFSRKSYFCVDLPLGYQLTQELEPIMAGGGVRLRSSHVRRERDVGFIKIGLEHDSGRFVASKTQVEFVRAGVGLIEMATCPCVDGCALKAIVAKLRLALKAIDACGGVMADADLRFDVNVSASLPLAALSCRTEVKNVNWLTMADELVAREASRALCGSRRETRSARSPWLATSASRRKELGLEYRHARDADLPALKL